MSSSFEGLTTRTEVSALVAFADLTRFQASSLKRDDHAIAEFLDALYRRTTAAVERDGRVVKYMGDAALIVVEEGRVDAGVTALLALKRDTDAWLEAQGWRGSRLVVKAHFGPVIAGPYGSEGRFDVVGNTVNTAATLEAREFALSAQAFRQLSPPMRQHFKKHTPPITYIRTEDRHR